jgi:hypothetical protein
MGFDSILVEGFVWCGQDDECEVENRPYFTRIPKRDEIKALPGSRSSFYEWKTSESETAILF